MHMAQYILLFVTFLSGFIPSFLFLLLIPEQLQSLGICIFTISSVFFFSGVLITNLLFFCYFVTISEKQICMKKPFKKMIVVPREQIIKISSVLDRNRMSLECGDIKYIVVSYRASNFNNYLKLSRDLLHIKKIQKALKDNNYKIESVY